MSQHFAADAAVMPHAYAAAATPEIADYNFLSAHRAMPFRLSRQRLTPVIAAFAASQPNATLCRRTMRRHHAADTAAAGFSAAERPPQALFRRLHNEPQASHFRFAALGWLLPHAGTRLANAKTLMSLDTCCRWPPRYK